MSAWLLTAVLVQAPLELTWDAPAACPDESAVRDAVEQGLVGRPTPQTPLTARGTVTTSATGYTLSLTMEHGEATSVRTVEAAGCDELADLAALLLVMTLDPLAGRPGPQPEPAPEPIVPKPEPKPEPDPDPTPAPKEEAPTRPSPPPEPERDEPTPKVLDIRGAAGVGGGWGPLPGAGAAFSLSGGLGQQHWAAHVTAEAWLPSEAGTPAGNTVRVWLAGFGVQGCGILTPAKRWTVPLCAAVVAGPMSARGRGVDTPRTRRTAWLAARVEPGVVGWVLPFLGLGLHASGHYALRRPGFTVDGAGAIHTARALGVRGMLGVSFRNRRTW